MPPTRSNTSPNASASPEPQPSKELPERSRNAKAQARHREKRKAYISHLEQSVATLKQQLASMGISGAIPAHALSTTGSTSSQAETDARLRELIEENERLKSEIQRLRSKVESMGGGSNYSGASSRSSTGGHHGLTPPATPGVLGGLGSTGGLLPATSSSATAGDAFDGRRGSVMGGGPVESFLASAFVPFLTISPPPTSTSPPLQHQPPHLFAPTSSPSSLLESPYSASSPFFNSSATPSPYASNSPSPIPSMGGGSSSSPSRYATAAGHPGLSFAQYGSSSSESSYPYPSSSSRLSLQSFAIM